MILSQIHILATAIISSLLFQHGATFDSEGRNFVLLFSRNFAQNRTRVWVTLINRNANSVQVSVEYPQTPDNPVRSQSRTTQNVTVSGNNFMNVDLPSVLAWDYANSGLQRSYDTRIFVTSSASITVLGNNQDTIDLQTDTFLVTPVDFVTALSPQYRYAVAAPKPSISKQFTVFTFIPLIDDLTLEVIVNGNKFVRDLTVAKGSWQEYFGVSSEDASEPTVYASGDKPFAMVVASSCAPTTRLTACDHAAFMPQPLTSDYFDPSTILHDHHLTDLWSSQSFYVVPPRSDVSTFLVDGLVYKNGSNVAMIDVPVDPSKTTRKKFEAFEIGDIADLESENCLIQVTRMGGLPFAQRGGAFLDVVPAWSQAISEPSAFISRYPNDMLMCFLDPLSWLFLNIDGKRIQDLQGVDLTWMDVDEVIIWQAAYRIPTPGFHKLDFSNGFSGNYSCYVMGNATQDVSYGYLVGFNRQQVLFLPGVSTTTSTTTTTTARPTTTGSTVTASSGATSPTSTTITTTTTTTTVTTTNLPTSTVTISSTMTTSGPTMTSIPTSVTTAFKARDKGGSTASISGLIVLLSILLF